MNRPNTQIENEEDDDEISSEESEEQEKKKQYKTITSNAAGSEVSPNKPKQSENITSGTSQIGNKKVKAKLGKDDNQLDGALNSKVSTSYTKTLKQLDAMKDAITKDKNDRATVD